MKTTGTYYVELKSRSHYYDFEARCNYNCKQAVTMKKHFKGHPINLGYDTLCSCIDNLCRDFQNTGWFNDGGEQIRIVYVGETIINDEQTGALLDYASNAITSAQVAEIFHRDEDCVREILADFMEDWNNIKVDEEGPSKEQDAELDKILIKYARIIVE